METIILIVVFSLAWGSFLNVIIYRLPLRMSLLRPLSSCPHCQARIKVYDNIPLLSYLLLGGKCRKCRARISFIYPLVELLTPLCFMILYYHFSLSVHFFTSAFFVSALIALGFIDFTHQILPDEITLPGVILALFYAAFRPDLKLIQALMGVVVGAGILLLIYGAYYLLRKKEGLGLGDVAMMLMIGAYLGWRQTLLTLILASLLGALVGVFFILYKKKTFQFALPFGAFLAAAAFVSLIWGERIITAYLSVYKT